MNDMSLEIKFLSKLDETMQPALFWRAEGDEPRPLVVALHTWSAGLEQSWDNFLVRCQKRNWHLIYPYFRGPNWSHKACGSDLVVSDLECCVDYVRENAAVDESKIFLIGGSGGGYASLLMAGRAPHIWTAVSAWCPISDLAAWHAQCKAAGADYYEHIERACGGNPQTSDSAARQAKRRSALTYLENSREKTIVDIGTGIHDGHTGSVPISHAVNAFNALADEKDRISQEDIEFIVANEKVPEHLRFDGEDIAYGKYKVLLRRISGMVRLTLFEGGHNIVEGAGFGFFDHQERGKAPCWNSGDVDDTNSESVLGK